MHFTESSGGALDLAGGLHAEAVPRRRVTASGDVTPAGVGELLGRWGASAEDRATRCSASVPVFPRQATMRYGSTGREGSPSPNSGVVQYSSDEFTHLPDQ